jgi:hypothetical protein
MSVTQSPLHCDPEHTGRGGGRPQDNLLNNVRVLCLLQFPVLVNRNIQNIATIDPQPEA